MMQSNFGTTSFATSEMLRKLLHCKNIVPLREVVGPFQVAPTLLVRRWKIWSGDGDDSNQRVER